MKYTHTYIYDYTYTGYNVSIYTWTYTTFVHLKKVANSWPASLGPTTITFVYIKISLSLSLSLYICTDMSACYLFLSGFDFGHEDSCFPGIHVPLPFRRKEPVVDVSEDEEDEDENFWDKESFWQMTVFVVPAWQGWNAWVHWTWI